MSDRVKYEVKVDSTEDKLVELIDRLLERTEFQREFEDNPHEVLKSYGIEIPEEYFKEGVDLPSLLKTLESDYQVMRVQAAARAATSPAVRAAAAAAVAITVAPAPVPARKFGDLVEKEKKAK